MAKSLAKTIHYGTQVSNHKNSTGHSSVNWCKELHWRTPPLPFAIALASYPGSGNTWLRYLLQQVTGIVTGSVSLDYSLRKQGFPAENISDGSVLVVKTHKYPPKNVNKFESAILLIRNPRDAILAEFNRINSGHTGIAPKSAFDMKVRAPRRKVWVPFVSLQLRKWEIFHNLWLTKFPGPVYIVFYEALLSDTRNTLQGILIFLNITVTEGLHRRTPPLPFAIALASYPGSGNTWLRYLLQQVTGIVIGSQYYDFDLRKHGFPAEGISDGSVLVMKTHDYTLAIQLRDWENFHNFWLTKYPGPDDMNCALTNKDGLYKRKKKYKDLDPFTHEMYRQIDMVKTRILKSLIQKVETRN
ncbi:WSCD family member CG9164 [Papilio xuthus]|uniref:WSCD family member CG9164 n=1 Tax=Papilio xuthus TaxID=66420 RepID=A0A194PIM0_PAPXU|nr:WSCD family member CG9164 [Papilio xuthus]